MPYPSNPANGEKIGANLCARPVFPTNARGGWSAGTVDLRADVNGAQRYRLGAFSETSIAVPGPCVAGTYRISVYAYVASGTTVTAGIRPGVKAGAGARPFNTQKLAPTSGYAWQTVTETITPAEADTANASGYGMKIYAYAGGGSTALGIMQIRADLDDSPIAGYIDGDTADTATVQYDWDGTPFLSTASARAIVAADTTPPTVPTGLAVDAYTTTTVGLSWVASTGGPTGYNVYRDGVKVTAAPTIGTAYIATGLTPTTAYSFTVTAVDAAGNESAQSAPVTVTTDTPADTTPPSVPTGLAVTGQTQTTVGLSWAAASGGPVGYNVYIGGTTVVNPQPIDGTSGDVGGLTPDTAYSFTVTAVDAAGNESAQSVPVNARTLAVPVDPDPEPEPEPDVDPWSLHGDLAAVLAPRVAAWLSRPGDVTVTETAAAQMPSVIEYVRGYTRGKGFTAGGVPVGPLQTVIVAATARLTSNPEQLAYYSMADYSERPAVLAGWTLPELAVLKRYRRTTA